MSIKVNKEGFVYDTDGSWLPPINLKQHEVFEDFHRYTLVHGPRKSSKSFGLCHKTLRHCFDVNGAMFAIVCKTIKNAKSSGVWTLLTTRMLPMWQKDCYGFKVVEGPKTTGDTKLSFVRLRNRHGTISELQCHSLEHASEVEAKFKGPAYSGFWLSEADQYLNEHAFHIFCDALRLWPNVKYEEHQILLDMNPPDTGPNNFFHDLWFKFKDHPPKDEEEYDQIFHAGLHRIGFSLDDNPQLDERERRELIARYRKRRTLYNRFILGLWEMDITDGHFSDVYDEATHVMGRIDCEEAHREVLVPTAACTTLLTGWDVGESKNHSWHALEKITHEDPQTRRRLVSFSVIDELVVIKTKTSVKQFTEAVQEKIDKWNGYMREKHNVQLSWRHWSDTSAFQYSARSNTTDAALVYEASGGKIILRDAPKYKNSNHDRVKLIWQLLYEKRLYISAQLLRTRQMFANLRHGGDAEYIKEDDHKHPFDSMSYPIAAEAPGDMIKSAELTTAPADSPGLIMSRF